MPKKITDPNPNNQFRVRFNAGYAKAGKAPWYVYAYTGTDDPEPEVTHWIYKVISLDAAMETTLSDVGVGTISWVGNAYLSDDGRTVYATKLGSPIVLSEYGEGFTYSRHQTQQPSRFWSGDWTREFAP